MKGSQLRGIGSFLIAIIKNNKTITLPKEGSACIWKFTSIPYWKKIRKILEINKEAERIYKRYGAIESDTFTAVSIQAEYGCAGMVSAVELHENEILMLEVNRYHDQEHHRQVLEKVDNDEQIGELYRQMTKVIDMSRTVRLNGVPNSVQRL